MSVCIFEDRLNNEHESLTSFETGLSRTTTDENLFNAFAQFGNLREGKSTL